MKRLTICGGRPLCGEVAVSGFKNAALPVLFATILIRDICVIENLPLIRDVGQTLDILRAMGARISYLSPHTAEIDTRALRQGGAPDALVSSFRASSYLLGAELSRFGRAGVALPGGCRIGARPLDLHLLVLSALGADTAYTGDGIFAAASRLVGNDIFLPTPSVGATVNALLASVLAEGETVIHGAAREPHIVDLALFLNAAGGDIRGAGEGEIRVRGVASLHGVRHTVMPDMIEAGTFLTSVGAAGGEIRLIGALPDHLASLTAPLREMGVSLLFEREGLLASRCGPLFPFCLTAEPYPGFPTDMHPQMIALSAFAEGVSYLTDTVFPDRFAYAGELAKMGADIHVKDGSVKVCGGGLSGARVQAHDLRAGAALAVAALGATGRTVIGGAEILERGYEDFPTKLRALGADVGEA
ncbi:MAG: UDP-N-acetylglucosamine 1-carboxyvinyltransferase [Clostridia bacterium]|nr:UDP-N-acetylglucosamine 1-carboxyvinyltransferase [Clostridia bacterium]